MAKKDKVAEQVAQEKFRASQAMGDSKAKSARYAREVREFMRKDGKR